jgi:hypothetical protein
VTDVTPSQWHPALAPALLPAAALAGIGIAVVVSVDVAHDGWGLWWLLLGALFMARRVIGCAGACRRPEPRALTRLPG